MDNFIQASATQVELLCREQETVSRIENAIAYAPNHCFKY